MTRTTGGGAHRADGRFPFAHMRQAITLLVLGDLARSPRMLYHLESLLSSGFQVATIAYVDTELPRHITAHPALSLYPLGSPRLRNRHALPRPLFLLYSLYRLVGQFFTLAWLLLVRTPRAGHLLMQAPPAIPGLLLAKWTARLRGSRLVVDWHNFGYSLTAMQLGPRHPLTRLSRWFEQRYARAADINLCVSAAMRSELVSAWGLSRVQCFHDHAPSGFSPDHHGLPAALGPLPAGYEDAAILVSGTSWTVDENLELLLQGLAQYDRQAADATPLLVFLTGKGPGKAAFLADYVARRYSFVRVLTPWLPAEDYPRLLAAADLGLSLHTSSSGLDLPMKVADMLGCGLPVCAYDYGMTLREKITPGANGLLFASAEQLGECLLSLFDRARPDRHRLPELRAYARAHRPTDWHSHWQEQVLPLLSGRAQAPRVAFVHPTLGFGGAERWLVDTAVSLQALGCDVTIYTGHFDPQACFEEINEHALDVQVRGRFIPAEMGGRLRAPLAILRMAWVAVRLRLQRRHFDLLVVDLVSHVLPLLKQRKAGKTMFYGHYPDQLLTGRRTRLYGLYRRPIDWLERKGLGAADQIWVNSEFTRRRFQETFPQIVTRVQHPGIAVEAFASIPALPDASNREAEITLLSVSRFHPDKNLGLAVHTLDRLRELCPGSFARVRLVLAGGYQGADLVQRQEYEGLNELVRRLGLGEHVEFLPSCSDEALKNRFAHALCLVYTPEEEHFGLVPLEMMAAGRPVVACDSGGPAETLLDGDTGLLCAPDADSFAHAVCRLIEEPGLASEMGAKARTHVQRFDRRQLAVELLQVLEHA